MIKIIGSLIIILSSTYTGFVYGEELKKRVENLREFEKGVYLLKNEMFYTYTSLPEAFKSISSKSKGEVKIVFKRIWELLNNNQVEDVYEGFKISIDENKTLKLKEEDIDIILNLSKNLGKSDLEGQRAIISFTIESLRKQINIAERIMEKNTKMYRYLGFSVGAMLVIMLL